MRKLPQDTLACPIMPQKLSARRLIVASNLAPQRNDAANLKNSMLLLAWLP
jgi:hypothetical protein